MTICEYTRFFGHSLEVEVRSPTAAVFQSWMARWNMGRSSPKAYVDMNSKIDILWEFNIAMENHHFVAG